MRANSVWTNGSRNDEGFGIMDDERIEGAFRAFHDRLVTGDEI
jgi:hypothetical protein